MLPPLYGHEEPRAALTRAAASGELPGSLLLHGPLGVGRQRLALWLAQLLLCAAPGEEGACGECAPCRMALRLEHPDLHWFFPLPRPKGASGDKLGDALEDARAAELAARRADPYRATAPGEPVGLFLAHVQTVRRLAHARPTLGSKKVFIVGDAEHLVPQESSPEAANALLKVLEEPPADTTFILTASGATTLLPTLTSRLLPVRLRPLPEGQVARFLTEVRGVDPARAPATARLAQGSIGRALGFLPVDGQPGPLEALRMQARDLLSAAAASSAVPRLAAAHALPPAGARGVFTELLDALALWIRDLAAVANGAEDALVNHDHLNPLRDLARRLPAAAAGAPRAFLALEEAQALAQGNVNPQLILASLLPALHRALKEAS
jgi:DNA polymerase-3 subunit delta'